ncbi:MAG: hypothetical protein K2P95_01710 [Hyphomonadaceae bacterium]|nr:hypothetical protein [Hyphomonadaceae bacterium]
MKLNACIAAAGLVFGLAACKPPATGAPANPAQAACAAGDARLPGTGLCQIGAVNLFAPERLSNLSNRHDELPPGCQWLVNETMTPDPNEAILYLALQCGKKTTKLEFSAGAHSAALGYGVSGFFENVPAQGEEGWERVRLFRLEGVPDPKAMILEIALGNAREQGAAAAEIAACTVREAPEIDLDAYLVDVNDAYKKANKLGAYDDGPKDMPNYGVYGACGPFGVTDASGDFWLIRDGYAWFVQQGQDTPDFDAASLWCPGS